MPQCQCFICLANSLINDLAKSEIAKWFPQPSEFYTKCPRCHSGTMNLWLQITHMNDYHEMSFVEIANWLEKENANVLITNI